MALEISEAVLASASELVGEAVRVLGPTARGASGSTHLVEAGRRTVVLKIDPVGVGTLDNYRRLAQIVNRLRLRGYPAPEYLGVGHAEDFVFSVQEHLPGATLEPAPGVVPPASLLKTVLPSLVDAVELQADAGDLADPPWPNWLLTTLIEGGDGYCLHETMDRRDDTRELLRRLRPIAAREIERPVRATDVMHFDLNPTNILHLNGRLTGIVDWNVPFTGATQGDRGFDLATLLFYTYDVRAHGLDLWERLIAISGVEWAKVYLCHLVLRQVEWSVRNEPGSAAEAGFIAISKKVLDDCEHLRS